jgi:hypothetical protein
MSEVLLLETELDAVSEVESVGSVVSSEFCELDKSEDLVSDEESVLLDASLTEEDSDELPKSVGSEICSEVAVDASRLALDEELLLPSLLGEIKSVDMWRFELRVTSELSDVLKTVISSEEIPVESLSISSSDTLAASELELLNEDIASTDDELLANDSGELALLPELPDSVLIDEKSLLDVRGVTSVDTPDDAVSDGTTSDEKMSSSPEPSESVAPDTGVTP